MIKFPGGLTLTFAGVLAMCIAFAFAGDPAPRPADVSQITGTWRGASYAFPELFEIKLTLQADGAGGLVGQIDYVPAVKDNQIGTQAKGSFKVTGNYDPVTRTFHLNPGAPVDRNGMTGPMPPIVGVLDARTGDLAGLAEGLTATNTPALTVLARDEAGTKLIADLLKSAVADPEFRPPDPGAAAILKEQQDRTARQTAARAAQAQARADQIAAANALRAKRGLPPIPIPATAPQTPPGVDERVAAARAAEGLPPLAPQGSDPRVHVAAAEPAYPIPSTDQLIAWAARMKREYPDFDLGPAAQDKVFLMMRDLFGDDDFKPVFGMNYDELDQLQRYQIMGFIQSNKKLFNDNGNFYLTALDQEFTYTGIGGIAETTVSVFWQRALRGWALDAESSMEQMSAEPDAFLRIAGIESQKASIAMLWPSESTKFVTLIAQTRTRLAVPILEASADKTIASAHDLQGAKALAGWMNGQKNLLQYAPPDKKLSLSKRINAREDELVNAAVAEDARAIANLGNGLAAVTAGNAWYAQFSQKYGFANSTQQMTNATKTLQARRPADLAAAAPAILENVNRQTSVDALESTARSYLQVPGDSLTKTAAQILSAVRQRNAQLDRDKFVASLSNHEKQWLKADGSFAPPDPLPPPDADDLRVAILRTLCVMGGERTAVNVVHMTNPIASQMGIYAIITLDKVDLLAAQRDPGGFKVDYRPHATYEMSKNVDNMLGDNSLSGIMMQSMLNSANGPTGMQSARFEFNENGWWCPTMLNPPIKVQIVQ